MARAASIVENSGDGMDMANHFVHGNDTCSRVKLNNYKISIHNIADTSTGILRGSTDFQKDTKMLEDKATGSPVKERTTRQRHDLPCDVTLSVAAAIRLLRGRRAAWRLRRRPVSHARRRELGRVRVPTEALAQRLRKSARV